MNSLRFKLLLGLMIVVTSASSQTLTQYHIGVGNSSNVLSGSTSFKYNNGLLTMGSTTYNQLAFQNPAGTGYLEMDGSGNYIWWTVDGIKRVGLSSTGEFKIGTSLAGGSDYGDYKLQVQGASYFNDLVRVVKVMPNASIASAAQYNASKNEYVLDEATTNNAYHSAQENTLTAGNTTSTTISGYQSAAQKNLAYLSHHNYTDLGAGSIWSVQTNTFYPDASNTLSKFINTYVRTQLGTGNTIGTYYSLLLESPFGSGSVSQITNYWGVYQESTAAKNFFAGKVGIGTVNMSDASYKLFVETGIKTRKIKVDALTWSDYVFYPSYKLKTLKEVEAFIAQHKHLPDVPSASEVEKNGIDLGENQAVLLKKIEELTLYAIDQHKTIDLLIKRIEQLEKKK